MASDGQTLIDDIRAFLDEQRRFMREDAPELASQPAGSLSHSEVKLLLSRHNEIIAALEAVDRAQRVEPRLRKCVLLLIRILAEFDGFLVRVLPQRVHDN